MELLKKLTFPEHILSSRRKVLTRFCVGVCASLVVFTALLFSNSLKDPITPLFHGFNSVGANSSSTSWRFSFSSPRSKEGLNGGNGEGVISGNTHLGNSTIVDEQKPHEPNGSVDGNIGGVSGSGGEPMDPDKTRLKNSSEIQNNVDSNSEEGKIDRNSSFTATEKGINGGTHVINSTDVNCTLVGNFSSDLEHGGLLLLPCKEGRSTGAAGRNSTEKIETKISYSQLLKKPDAKFEDCDIYDGNWVRDDSKPYYPAGSCPYIDKDFDCHFNKRPDDGFLKWKWKPNGCDLPSLNATDFLERLRGKNLVFVGDSLNRNMWESLVCILRHSVKKERVYEISGRTEFKKKGFYAFRFEDYNCTVDFVGSPFLVSESTFQGKNGTFETLRLDVMDRTASMYQDADIIVFNTGHWWTHEKTSKGEDYYQEGDHVYPRLKVLQAYTKALTTWARWVDQNIDRSRTQVFFRGYSVTHFRGGPWNSGGKCHNETEPFYDLKYLAKYPSKMKALEYVLQDMKTPVMYMNISRLTDFRKDGHPSIYRTILKTAEEKVSAVKFQDCSHWCLPGVPDTWNELLYASLLKTGRGSWRN